MNLVLVQPEKYAFAEECCLFYVTRPRAKKKVFLIGGHNSIFIEEIIFKEFLHIPQDGHKQINRDIPVEWLCPQCK